MLKLSVQPPPPTTKLTLHPTGAPPVQTGVKQTTLRIGGQVGPTAADYKKYDARTHAYMLPGMYIGADTPSPREEWIYNFETGRAENSQVDFVPGCERLFLEVLTNASDNVGRSRRAGVDPGNLEITMNAKTVTIKNFGLPIPIEMHPEEQKLVPTLVFGSMRTGSNYEKDRHEAGVNGLGVKLANIFSHRLTIAVYDAIRHKSLTQEWTDNMKVCHDPVVQDYTGQISSVEVSYDMDFARFGYQEWNGTSGGYTVEAFALFARHALDISLNAKTKVIFNGIEFNISNIREYARLYFGDIVDSGILHYEWPEGTEVTKKRNGVQTAKDQTIVPHVEMIVMDTPDQGKHVSFVNCMMTRDGGVHVNAAMESVGRNAVNMVNKNVLEKIKRQNKGKELTAEQKRSHSINIADVRPHLSIIVAVRVQDPKFTSQSKTQLNSPTPKVVVTEDELRPMQKWELIDRLYAAMEAKQFRNMKKSDGKMSRYIRLRKGIDANQAGKAQRHKCVLYASEGQSAAGYIEKMLKHIPNGRDYVGVLPMRGKGLNVMNADRFKIENNAEIAELKKMLGLVEGTDYSVETNFKKLRYSALMIMADSDVDGKHIIGLVLLYFHCRFPSLLARGYVMYYRTPIVRVKKGAQVHKFYIPREYELWRQRTPDYEKWNHKYYKGLGTSTNAEIKDDYMNPRVIYCFYDDQAPTAMRLAFDKRLADQRKDWIGAWRNMLEIEDIQLQPISQFINFELILYSVDNVKRSIPRLIDGFKESHRKLIHGSHQKFKIGPLEKKYTEVKVAQLSAYVAGETHYHHGERILDDVIVGMVQDFVGSNNVRWFVPGGQFGTRYRGGKDSSQTRYTFTQPERLLPYIIRKEDAAILEHLNDEGEKVEPVTYYPIIPMILVNGGHGIATGHSTYIPNHNPLDIIKWIRMRLQGHADLDLPDVLPWYLGFKGFIQVIDRRKGKQETETNPNVQQVPQIQVAEVDETLEGTDAEAEENEYAGLDEDDYSDDEVDPDRPRFSMITTGCFHIEVNGTIVVTELPIGRWSENYHKWLEELVEKKKITGFRDNSIDNDVYFEIYGFKDTPNIASLKLKKSYGLTNMVLLDENDRPTRYDTSHDILQAYYLRRLPAYQRRKDYILGDLSKQIETLNHKIRFIRAILDKEIRIKNRKTAETKARMAELGIPGELLDSTSLRHLSEEDIAALMAKIQAKTAEIQTLLGTTPEQMWTRELDELERVYRLVYKEKEAKPALVKLTVKPTTIMSNGRTIVLKVPGTQ